MFVELCNHQDDLSLDHFHHPKETQVSVELDTVYQDSVPGEDSSHGRRVKIITVQSSHCGSAVTNPTSIHEGLAQRVKDPGLP